MSFIHSFDLIGLFFSSFLAATFFPIGCEPIFVYLVSGKGSMILSSNIIFIASVGNTLGGMVTYLMGLWLPLNRAARFLKINMKHAGKVEEKIQKFGHWFALLCWLPVVGDLVALLLGHFKVSPKLSFLLMFAGKFLRFFILALFVVIIKDF